MISIKRLLEQSRGSPKPERDVTEALRQMCGLLLDGMATHIVRGRESDCGILRRTLRELARQMDQPQSPMSLLRMSSDAIEALDTYGSRTTEYLREENEQMQSMVTMLTETLADLSGQTDASVSQLQAIDRDLELASGLDDIRAVRSSLENCLLALRESAAQQRSSSSATAERLRNQIAKVQARTSGLPNNAPFAGIDRLVDQGDPPKELTVNPYVAAFKLQRAEHIALRFGESATNQMLSTLGAELKALVGPQDRLLRWKGPSFLMFVNSTETLGQIKARLASAVAAIGMQYVEVGKRSAMLAVGVDWMVFPQSNYASLEAALADVETFLTNNGNEPASSAGAQR